MSPRTRRSDEAKTRQHFGEKNGPRTTHARTNPRVSEVDDKNGGATLFELRPEVQPATTVAPGEVQSLLVDAGGDIREGTERGAGAKKEMPSHGYPHAGQLEGDVLLRAVGQQITEKDRRLDLHSFQPMTSRCGEIPCSLLGSGLAFFGLLTSDAPLVLPDRRSELEREVGVVAIEDGEASNELGTLPQERPDVVLAMAGPWRTA